MYIVRCGGEALECGVVGGSRTSVGPDYSWLPLWPTRTPVDVGGQDLAFELGLRPRPSSNIKALRLVVGDTPEVEGPGASLTQNALEHDELMAKNQESSCSAVFLLENSAEISSG